MGAVVLHDDVHVLHRDHETRSTILLKAVGAHCYATHPRTEVLCVAYAVDHDPVQLWTPVIRCHRNSSKPRAIQVGL
jgi:hypothetical protein